MGDTGFPLNPDELTPQWLTDALRKEGCIRDARVVSLTCEVIGEGVGFLGQIARLTPTYDQLEEGAPSTLIGKFPTPNESSRELAAMYGFYACEVNVYRHLSAEVGLRTPRCYFSAISDDGKTFLLLLDDLGAGGRMGDQVRGCTLDEARLALRELARLHAAWWGDPRLDGMDWLPLGTELGRMSMSQAYPAGWQLALDQFGHLLSPAQKAALPTLNERVMRLIDDTAAPPLTIMHADYRLDNMFFGGADCAYEFAIIDWQITNRGWGAYDVAYFMGSNLDPKLRRAAEMDLLGEYHSALAAQLKSGAAYPWETCRTDYVQSMGMFFANMVANVASIDMTNERGVELFEMIIGRVATAAEELQALDALP